MAFHVRTGAHGGPRRTTIRLLCAAVLLLTACSVVRVAYNNADLYLSWKADEYFGLDGAQKALLQEKLDALTRWHRSEELPRYTATFALAGDRVGSGLTAADIEWALEALRARYDVLAREGARRTAPVLSALTPAQMAYFETKLARDNDRFAEEYVAASLEAQRTRRYERTVEMIEEWVGPLSAEQRSRIEAHSLAIPMTSALRLEDRARRQRELIAILHRDRTRPEFAAKLETWLVDWDKGRSSEYDRRAKEARQRMVAMVLELDRSLTAEQRLRAQRRLYRYADEFRALSTSSPAKSASAALTQGPSPN